MIFVNFSPDGSRIITTAEDNATRIWLATMSATDLVAEACTRRLPDLTKLTRDEMRQAGYPYRAPEINVCASIE